MPKGQTGNTANAVNPPDFIPPNLWVLGPKVLPQCPATLLDNLQYTNSVFFS